MSINGINYRNNKKQLSRKIVKVLRISDNKDDTPIPNQSHQIENYIHNKYISNKSISKLEYDGYSSFSHKKQIFKNNHDLLNKLTGKYSYEILVEIYNNIKDENIDFKNFVNIFKINNNKTGWKNNIKFEGLHVHSLHIIIHWIWRCTCVSQMSFT